MGSQIRIQNMETLQIALKLFSYVCLMLHTKKDYTVLQTYTIWNGKESEENQELGIIASGVIRSNIEHRHNLGLL